MKLKNVIILLASLIVLTSIATMPTYSPIVPPVVPEGAGDFEKHGPRVTDLIYKVGGDLGTEANFLEQGQIDVMDWAAPGAVTTSWLNDPDITMGDYSEFGWYEFDLNVQMWPVGHGSMNASLGELGGAPPPPEADWTFPSTWDEGHYWINYSCQRCLDSREFRRALAHLVDRSAGACVPAVIGANMETFIFPAISPWENPAAQKYAFGVSTARSVLNAAGFKDYDGDTKLEYHKDVAVRNAWSPGQPAPPGTEELPDLQLWIRTDDPDRKHAGELLRDNMLLLGIPLDAYIASRSLCYYHAWTVYDYSIYTGGWGWVRVPDMYYELWHTEKDTYPNPSGDAYNRYHHHTGSGEEIDGLGYDEWAWELKTAATIEDAETALDNCQLMLARDVGCIPLYTYKGWLAHRTKYPSTTEIPGLPVEEQRYSGRNWTGFVNERGYSFYSDWCPLNAHPQGFDKGGTYRQGIIIDVVKFDPVDAEWFYDWLVLGQIYETLIVYHPNDTKAFIPWMCKSYTVGEWDNDGSNATKITFEIIPNILWHDDVPFTPYDVAFTYQYMKDTISVANSPCVLNYDHADYNDTHVTLFFDVQSWLVPEWVAACPIIPSHIWESIPPVEPGDPTPGGSWAYDPEAEDTVIGTGPFRFNKDDVVGRVDRVPGQYVHLEANPTYFRKIRELDVCGSPSPTPNPDGVCDAYDIQQPLIKYGYEENYDGTWPSPPGNDWGEACDVNKDGVISMADVMEIGLQLGQSWPPIWY